MFTVRPRLSLQKNKQVLRVPLPLSHAPSEFLRCTLHRRKTNSLIVISSIHLCRWTCFATCSATGAGLPQRYEKWAPGYKKTNRILSSEDFFWCSATFRQQVKSNQYRALRKERRGLQYHPSILLFFCKFSAEGEKKGAQNTRWKNQACPPQFSSSDVWKHVGEWVHMCVLLHTIVAIYIHAFWSNLTKVRLRLRGPP